MKNGKRHKMEGMGLPNWIKSERLKGGTCKYLGLLEKDTIKYVEMTHTFFKKEYLFKYHFWK